MRTEFVAFGLFGLQACLAQSWTYSGCYVDSTSNRTLKYTANVGNNNQTVEACESTCASNGYSVAGLEYGSECYCDHTLSGATSAPESDCSMTCSGNSSEICGNGYRLSVYSSGSSTYVPPSTNPGPPGWSLLGCYTDSTSSRSLRYGQSAGSNGMTVAGCTSACSSAGYPLAGVEYASQCFCDWSIQNQASQTTSGCDMTCSGNSSEYCGGSNRLNVYQASATAGTVSPTGWAVLGCYTDDVNARTLPNGQAVTGGAANMTIEGCLSACNAAGYVYAGVEYAQECYCANALANNGSCASDQSTCNMGCRGNGSEICGGSNRLNLFYSGTDKSVVACSAGSAASSSSSSVSLSTTTTTSVVAGTLSTTSTTTALSTTMSTVTTTASSAAASSSSTTTTPMTISSAPPSSSSTTTTTSTTTSSSTTTSATPTQTGCPQFWANIVADLANNFRTNGVCNNNSRASIRYAFHDSASFSKSLPFYAPAAGGADGSLLLSSTEINRPDHAGLRDYHAWLTSKFAQYKNAGYPVGAADLIQVAGAVGVLACPGGRTGYVLVGRTDTNQSSPDGLLPQAFGNGSDHNTIFALFQDKGFSARDLAALIGAHSTSIANFQASNGLPAGTPQDTTPTAWDVTYYNQTYNPVSGMGSFASDINLAQNTSRTAVGYQFKSFVGAQAAWQASFSSAYKSLSVLGIPSSVQAGFQDCTSVVNAAFPS